jgi:hypothetical protein
MHLAEVLVVGNVGCLELSTALRALRCTGILAAIPNAASGVNELLDTFSADCVTTRDDDCRIGVRIKTHRTLEVLCHFQAMYDVWVKILCPTQQVIFCDVLGSWLAQVLNQMWVAACLPEAEKKHEDVRVIGCTNMSETKYG